MNILDTPVRTREAEVTLIDAHQQARAIVVHGDSFISLQRQTQHPDSVVFQIEAIVFRIDRERVPECIRRDQLRQREAPRALATQLGP